MGFSNIATQQREKAAESLKSFLALGLIGSVGLHIGVLGFGIGNFLDKVSPLQDKPMELTLIEPPTLEIEKPVEEAQEKLPPSSSNETPKVVSAPSSITIAPSSPSVVTQKPHKPSTNIPKKQVVEDSKTPLPQQKPIHTSKEIARPQPAPVAKITAPSKVPIAPEVVAASPTVPSSVAPRSPNNQKLRDLLATTRNTQQKPNNISANSKPNALGLRQLSNSNNLLNPSGSGTVNSTASDSRITGNTPGTSTNRTADNSTVGTSRANSFASGSRLGTNSRSGSNVATGTQNVRPRNAQPDANSNSNASSGGLACRTCSKPKYPTKARRRGLEGKTEINVDVDDKGNVTEVRLARSSGHSELDKAALEEARRWKFKAPSGGKRSVSAKVDFAIEGSERSRKLRERRKRRPADSRLTPIENARSNQATETTNTPTPTRRVIQRQNSISSPRRPQTAASRRVDTLPPRRSEDAALPRQRVTSTRRSPQQAQSTNQRALGQSLRRQRQSSNQTKLRQSLRQLR